MGGGGKTSSCTISPHCADIILWEKPCEAGCGGATASVHRLRWPLGDAEGGRGGEVGVGVVEVGGRRRGGGGASLGRGTK